ncbi:zinc finger BED domain-containing protein RICESLEEPER 2-like [Neltuma alba]|uniref:zinc finger BED domain-containing protein RICESLEEPER 2-like n=1 Tax=Neltuma alba TaxID=207710 RepID=UPI0010A4AEA9|nr:zinc finger BED domain-containing protein RICESLEEPER 2-like [Prosopis alba]
MSNAQTGQEDYSENESRTIETPVNEKEKDTGLTSIEGEEGDEPRAKRQKSAVWDHFDKLPLSQTNGQLRAKCKYCPTTIACHSSYGTSGLKKHIESCVLNPNRINKKTQSLLSSSQLGSSKTLSHHVFNQEECRKGVALFVILDEMPFRVVEGDGFKEMMTRIEPRFQVPSRATVTRDCLGLYLEEARKLKMYFKRTKIDEEWIYQKRILNFCVVENHRGDTIASEIEKCLLAWGIEKVFTITVDNASSNDNAVAKLKDVLSHWNGLVFNGDFLHLRCCAHILNLIVCDGVKDMHKSIEGIRNAIKYVRSSPGRLLKFKELVEKMKIDSKSLLTMDCPTRWNSTYIMLENAIKFSSVFERMEKEDNDYTNYFVEKTLIGPPDASNWKDAKEFVVFLKVFYDITLQFSGSLYVTSNVCFQHIADVFVILHTRANNPNFLVSDMAKRMKVKYEKYWGKLENLNPLLVIAMVLDPRYKMKFLKLAFHEMFPDSTQREAMTNRVTNALYCLYDFYLSGHETNTSESQNQSQTQASSEPAGLSQLQMAMLESRPLLQLFVAQNEVEVETDKYAEVERYFQAKLVDVLHPNFDILAWWKVNSSKYKILSLIARDVLAMPVSTVSSESAFKLVISIYIKSKGI